jgi:predicted nucleic acid-binding protein
VPHFLDANILLAIHLGEITGSRVREFLIRYAGRLTTSDFVLAECTSAVARSVRTRQFTREDGLLVLTNLDLWVASAARVEGIGPPDVRAATSYLRRLDLVLRAPDAINIATAQRLQAHLVTLDLRMAESARALGVAVVEP